MAQYVYTMNRVGKTVPPKREILKDISLSFFPGAKIGVLGLNGAGKSTLLRIMAGIDTEFNGEARPQAGIKIGYLPQEPQLNPDKDVRGNVEEGLSEAIDAMAELEKVYAAYAEPDADFDALAKQQAKLEDIIQASDAHNLEHRLEVAADALRLPPWDADVSKISGGERRRVALCRLLLSNPDMLLLDEPTNHLDAESVAWLEHFLCDFPGTVVAITHDRYFLDNAAGWILELDRGRGIPYEGNYSTWLETKEQRLEQEARSEASRQKAIKAELEWVRSNPKGRQAKSKARLQRFEELNSQDFQSRNETNEIYIPPGPRLGDVVIEVDGVSKAYGDRLLFENLSFNVPAGAIVGIIGANGRGKTTLFRMLTGVEQPDSGSIRLGDVVIEVDGVSKAYGDRLLFENLSFNVPAGAIVGIIGANGRGKTTLFRMLTGVEQPDSGSIRLGETVKLVSVEQMRDALDDSKTVWEVVSDGADILQIGSYEVPSRAYIGRFNFKGSDQQKRVGELSGGERGRLHLACTLKQGGNVLLLDEPSNDLDVETLRALEDALLDFPGCALVISHDRWFLDRIATHILAYEGDSEVVFFEGNYNEYHEDFVARKGSNAAPKRMKYKKLK